MSRTVLVADDSPTIQRVVQLAFAEEADIDVVAVSSGSEAIEQIAARRPDLVLADTSMTDRTGYDVAESIKDDPVDDRIPVVLLTGAFEPVDETRAREAGCKTVLVKPFEPSTLVSTVRELLGPVDQGPSSDPLEPPPAPVLEITDELVDRGRDGGHSSNLRPHHPRHDSGGGRPHGGASGRRGDQPNQGQASIARSCPT